ncbi:hypothetical protein IT882_13230 [Microbacterium schleiferi]|uniref:Uncharacterized protein n=1 Tax=Microbacterium schleiferi TaxID=69362 RepID=A0A7S8MVR3_9MICO|nr:hypothetical protein [Microbacterium schleiferi]QPE04154.1 hypothetical protein IT882_13230 [Microbacterium schleiferi]
MKNAFETNADRLLDIVNTHPAGLTGSYDPRNDTIRIAYAGFIFSPETALLRASTATADDLTETIERFTSL